MPENPNLFQSYENAILLLCPPSAHHLITFQEEWNKINVVPNFVFKPLLKIGIFIIWGILKKQINLRISPTPKCNNLCFIVLDSICCI
jgi:hypothetical protein